MKTLEADRLVLGHPEPWDLKSLFSLCGDPEVRRYFAEGTYSYE